MSREIKSVAVLGGGTMGTGIAGLAAQNDCRVLLLDVTREKAEKALDKIVNGRPPAVEDPEKAKNITPGAMDDDLEKIKDYDWVCEAVIEDLPTKQAIFAKLDALRKPGSVVSTNTSGIPLADVTAGLPESLLSDVAVTHFFNPVAVMKLAELVPGAKTTPETIETFRSFLAGPFGKGVVNAKDTVNFIGNRIGCFFMLMGLHAAQRAVEAGVKQETIDAMITAGFGIPKTGLYGLIDLIGLDVMDFVGENLSVNLPAGDIGADFTAFPPPVRRMFENGQLGRKTGGGFYKVTKNGDGSRSRETFDLSNGVWRPAIEAESAIGPEKMFDDDAEGAFCWEIMGGTLAYAASLVPDISDDVVNVDRAMRWGFGWRKGPFELIDALGAGKFADACETKTGSLPKLLGVLTASGADSFYKDGRYLGTDGRYHAIPAE